MKTFLGVMIPDDMFLEIVRLEGSSGASRGEVVSHIIGTFFHMDYPLQSKAEKIQARVAARQAAERIRDEARALRNLRSQTLIPSTLSSLEQRRQERDEARGGKSWLMRTLEPGEKSIISDMVMRSEDTEDFRFITRNKAIQVSIKQFEGGRKKYDVITDGQRFWLEDAIE